MRLCKNCLLLFVPKSYRIVESSEKWVIYVENSRFYNLVFWTLLNSGSFLKKNRKLLNIKSYETTTFISSNRFCLKKKLWLMVNFRTLKNCNVKSFCWNFFTRFHFVDWYRVLTICISCQGSWSGWSGKWSQWS